MGLPSRIPLKPILLSLGFPLLFSSFEECDIRGIEIVKFSLVHIHFVHDHSHSPSFMMSLLSKHLHLPLSLHLTYSLPFPYRTILESSSASLHPLHLFRHFSSCLHYIAKKKREYVGKHFSPSSAPLYLLS